MGVILNFNNWSKLNEDATSLPEGQTPADLAALDTIQAMADQGPNMEWRGGTAAKTKGAETLVTSLAGTLNTGRVTKTITFNTQMDPLNNPKGKKDLIKAEFFGRGGKLYAVVYKNGEQVLNGPVMIKNHGTWKQIMSIGNNRNMELVDMSGAEGEYNDMPAPVAAGIVNVMYNLGGKTDNTNIPAAINVPRGGSNVKFSAKNVELTKFMNAERAKRNTATPTQPKA